VNIRRFVSAAALFIGLLAAAIGIDGCTKQSVTVNVRSLQDSSEVTFVCRGETAEGLDHGFARNECPDVENDPPLRKTLAVVTQTATNELAIVDIAYQKVVDVDPAVPGYTFLRLPSRPGAITSTPGGDASFVGLMSPGKTGISAIPTTCLGPPREGKRARDLTTFPACGLPSAPGDMVVVVEPPDSDGTIWQTCAHPHDPADLKEDQAPPGASSDRDCPANLTTEHGPLGRRKLVVSMPESGQLAVMDAQALLDRAPGSFDPCTIERVIDLDSSPDTSGQSQIPPADLEGCMPNMPTPPPVPANARSRPSGVAQAEDNKLYVGDLGVPAVHVVDASSVCGLHELPPLLPMSFNDPTRVVTTSHVTVSPETPAGHRYVYAVDASDQPASVMAFDVSPGSTDRTPIVRGGSSRQPREVPDRISFGAPVQDIDFAFRDLPREDPDTGVAEIGLRCDPNPDASIDPPTPGVQYRTTGDYTQGARPHLLRGLFGLALLTSGAVVVIDVDDLDQPCRRPITTNPDATEEDFRGCIGDTLPYSYLTLDGTENGTKTVSGEVSCNMVEAHRPRAAAFGLSLPTLGTGAPTLRGLPLRGLPPSVTNTNGQQSPKLLAVPFQNPGGASADPEVYVGTTLYAPANASGVLRVDPNDSNDVNSLALPLYEPRSYVPGNEHVDVSYEGRVFSGDKPSGFIAESTEPPDADGNLIFLLNDSTAFFCDNGVYDPNAMATYANAELGLKGDADKLTGAAGDFGKNHGDYVQITGDFPDLLDPYWASAPHDRGYCNNKFGPVQRTGTNDLSSELQPTRDLTIVSAYQDHLVVKPRVPVNWTSADCPADPAELELVPPSERYCPPTPQDYETCFPAGVRYTVRGENQWVLLSSSPQATRDVIADPANQYRCIRDCDPRKRYFRNRVFEIGAACGPKEDCSNISVGPVTAVDGPCAYDPIVTDPDTGAPVTNPNTGKPVTQGIKLDSPGAVCIFENLTARFAVYRGVAPSVRGMHFSWDTTSGYYPLAASLSAISQSVLPQRVHYMPEYQSFGVVDGASLGFSIIRLDTLQLSQPWPVY
jgi:hypothetical protein